MKRASYRDAIDYIAHNDDPAETDEHAVAGTVTVQLVAEIFGVSAAAVAAAVVKIRNAPAR